ncbi:P-loop NTPase [Alphaproteobacteria bacterium GH1-50]|uniref:P-loop NTPase n=1 Tax=Kangsaoukella pontilimi TaxID=2691042 RepID=A0A7C9INT8_9RHOB|nr:CpsD/CapB family tyrosine-protein kinase [Kangsaoukella pontilimi]MXQ06423.1 P-loop NTPase [Kangsaoukella pontilimi]
MEKLQAALARAREKREGGSPSRPAQGQAHTRVKSRQLQRSEALSSVWQGVPAAEPSTRRMQQSRIFAASASAEAASFDILRTKLLLEMRRNDWTRIAVTSATAGSGKTTMACNLIAGLGRQPEVRGMLFDMDFRRPSVAKFFGLSPNSNFADFLEEKVSFEDQALRLDQNTIVCGQSRPVRDPAQLVTRARTAEALDEIQAEYMPDIMLFDLPPVLVSDEARAFLKLMDAAIIVAAAEQSTVSQIDECEREVAGYTNVAGIVLNKCRHLSEGYGYSY